MKRLKIVTLEDGKCLAELKIEEEHTNPIGGLHGGLSATLIDSVSNYAFTSHPKIGIETPIVSVNIHTSFIKGAMIDDVILIDAKTIRVGKSIGFMEVDIRNKKTNDLLVKGTQTIYILSGDTYDNKK